MPAFAPLFAIGEGAADVAAIFAFIIVLGVALWGLEQLIRDLSNLPLFLSQLASPFIALENGILYVANLFANGMIGLLIEALRIMNFGLQEWNMIFHNPLYHHVDLIQWWIDTVINPMLNAHQAWLATIQWWIDTVINPMLNAQQAWLKTIQWWIDTVINPMLNTHQAWLATIQKWIDTVINPSIRFMQAEILEIQNRITYLITVTIPAIRYQLETFITYVTFTLTNPRTGILPRLGTAESTVAKLAPLVATGALTAAQADNLRKLSNDTCYCMTQGALQDDGTLQLAILMDLI